MTQERAYEIAMGGHNIFLTGKAGTGKTYLLNKIITGLKSEGKKVAITASTGIAATHIGGITIHSWASIGIKEKLTIDDLYKIKNYHKSRAKIMRPDVLVIDEISMLHDYRLDLVDQVIRFVRGGVDPFSGIQVILVGDFFQLPPVNKGKDKTNYTFHSEAFKAANFKVCYLEKIYRQENDLEFIDILNAIRNNKVSDSMKETLTKLSRNKEHCHEAINLYCRNIDVDNENASSLFELATESEVFEAQTYCAYGEEKALEKLLKDWTGQLNLELKIGAKVMANANKPEKKFYNGSIGEVIDFEEDSGLPVVQFFKNKKVAVVEPHVWAVEGDEDDIMGKPIVLASVRQIPLRLAYAITIHKSQGCTFDFVNLSLEDCFQTNMGYVALSRVTSLEGLYLSGYNYVSLKTDLAVISKDKEFVADSKKNEEMVNAEAEILSEECAI